MPVTERNADEAMPSISTLKLVALKGSLRPAIGIRAVYPKSSRSSFNQGHGCTVNLAPSSTKSRSLAVECPLNPPLRWRAVECPQHNKFLVYARYFRPCIYLVLSARFCDCREIGVRVKERGSTCVDCVREPHSGNARLGISDSRCD